MCLVKLHVWFVIKIIIKPEQSFYNRIKETEGVEKTYMRYEIFFKLSYVEFSSEVCILNLQIQLNEVKSVNGKR